MPPACSSTSAGAAAKRTTCSVTSPDCCAPAMWWSGTTPACSRRGVSSGAVRAVDDCDPRLEQRVSIRSTGQPLGSFLGALGIETGVTAKADPSIAHHKLTVLTKDLPLSQLLSGVAEALLLLLKSSVSVDGAFTHQFYEDRDSEVKAILLFYLD